MTTQLETVAVSTDTGSDLNHIYCCNPDIALCGTDIADDFEVDFDEANCVVCSDLDGQDIACSAYCPLGGAR